MNARMDCQPAEVLSQFLRGGLPDAMTEQIEEHLAGCSACLETVERVADLDPFCKMVSESVKCRTELDLFAEEVTRVKAVLQPLWPSDITPAAAG